MATLSKKFKKSNKSKSSSRSRKHFNKSSKNGLKTKKMRGGTKGWFYELKNPFKRVAPQPVKEKPVTMVEPSNIEITEPLEVSMENPTYAYNHIGMSENDKELLHSNPKILSEYKKRERNRLLENLKEYRNPRAYGH